MKGKYTNTNTGEEAYLLNVSNELKVEEKEDGSKVKKNIACYHMMGDRGRFKIIGEEIKCWVKEERKERTSLVSQIIEPIRRNKQEIIEEYNEKLRRIWLNQLDPMIPLDLRTKALNYLLGR